MVNPRTAFPIDTGLIPIFDRTGRANVGHALETAVLLELARRRMSVHYVRTQEGHEVDFVAGDSAGAIELIQVSAYPTPPDARTRELRSLDEAGAAYPQATRRLLTLTRDAVPGEMPAGVVAQPAYEWMLAR